jgi:hypothetical protein
MAGATLILMFLCIAASVLGKDGEKAVVNAGLGVFNRYIFRGYEIGQDSAVFQPSLGVAYKGFSVSFWGNMILMKKPPRILFLTGRGKRASTRPI